MKTWFGLASILISVTAAVFAVTTGEWRWLLVTAFLLWLIRRG